MLIPVLLGMYFDATVVFVTSQTLFLGLTLAILCDTEFRSHTTSKEIVMKRDRNVFPEDSICQVAQMHAIAFNSKCICISLLMFNLTEKLLREKKIVLISVHLTSNSK